MELTDVEIDKVAAAVFAYDAPRIGNDRQTFESLSDAEKRRFRAFARIALKTAADLAEKAAPE